jgi:hypothetical protein
MPVNFLHYPRGESLDSIHLAQGRDQRSPSGFVGVMSLLPHATNSFKVLLPVM